MSPISLDRSTGSVPGTAHAALCALLCLSCVSSPRTPEFESACRACRTRIAACATALGLDAWETCVRTTERVCMAEHGFARRPGRGWIRVPHTDRDVGIEIDRRLPR